MVAAKTSPKPQPKAEDSAPSDSMAEGFAPSDSMAESSAQPIPHGCHGRVGRAKRELPHAGCHGRVGRGSAHPPDRTLQATLGTRAHLLSLVVIPPATSCGPYGLRYIDAPLLRDRETDGGSAGLDERLYYTQDGNFNVTALVNTAGEVVERYSYDAYGQVTVRNGADTVDSDPDPEWDPDPDNASDVDNRLLYCGYRFDAETGLYHVRRRYLHPTLGRWTTRDPAGYVDGMGLYEYCMSSPVTHVDAGGAQSKSSATIYGRKIGRWYTVWRDNTAPRLYGPNSRAKIQVKEQKYWQEVRETGGNGMGIPERHVRKVRNCTVVVILDHIQGFHRNALSKGRMTAHPGGLYDSEGHMEWEQSSLRAVGTLSCSADSVLPPKTPLTGDGQLNYSHKWESVGPYQGDDTKSRIVGWERNNGTISGFPHVYNVIGPGSDTNAGYGKGKRGFHELMDAAWEAAVKQGNTFSQSKYCPCDCSDGITVVFVCDSADARKSGGNFCGKKKKFPCKKSKE